MATTNNASKQLVGKIMRRGKKEKKWRKPVLWGQTDTKILPPSKTLLQLLIWILSPPPKITSVLCSIQVVTTSQDIFVLFLFNQTWRSLTCCWFDVRVPVCLRLHQLSDAWNLFCKLFFCRMTDGSSNSNGNSTFNFQSRCQLPPASITLQNQSTKTMCTHIHTHTYTPQHQTREESVMTISQLGLLQANLDLYAVYLTRILVARNNQVVSLQTPQHGSRQKHVDQTRVFHGTLQRCRAVCCIISWWFRSKDLAQQPCFNFKYISVLIRHYNKQWTGKCSTKIF